MKLPPEDIAYPRSCNGVKKFTGENKLFASGAPIHVKGAIFYYEKGTVTQEQIDEVL